MFGISVVEMTENPKTGDDSHPSPLRPRQLQSVQFNYN